MCPHGRAGSGEVPHGKTLRCFWPWGVLERCRESLRAAEKPDKPRASGNAFLPGPRLQRHEMGLLCGGRLSRTPGCPGKGRADSASLDATGALGRGTVPLGTHPRSHEDRSGGSRQGRVPLRGDMATVLWHPVCAIFWERSRPGRPGVGRAVAAGRCRLEIPMSCCKTI